MRLSLVLGLVYPASEILHHSPRAKQGGKHAEKRIEDGGLRIARSKWRTACEARRALPLSFHYGPDSNHA